MFLTFNAHVIGRLARVDRHGDLFLHDAVVPDEEMVHWCTITCFHLNWIMVELLLRDATISVPIRRCRATYLILAFCNFFANLSACVLVLRSHLTTWCGGSWQPFLEGGFSVPLMLCTGEKINTTMLLCVMPDVELVVSNGVDMSRTCRLTIGLCFYV